MDGIGIPAERVLQPTGPEMSSPDRASFIDILIELMSVPGLSEAVDEGCRPWSMHRQSWTEDLLDEDA